MVREPESDSDASHPGEFGEVRRVTTRVTIEDERGRTEEIEITIGASSIELIDSVAEFVESVVIEQLRDVSGSGSFRSADLRPDGAGVIHGRR